MNYRKPAVVLLAALLYGCAAEPPIPFQLIDATSTSFNGSFDGRSQAMEVFIGETRYLGFYVIGTGVATAPQPWFPRRGFPIDMTTTFRTNTARAHLQSANGRHLNCEFNFEGRRAIGECRTPEGTRYQLVAGMNSGQ